MRYHLFPKLLKPGVRFRMLTHRDHSLQYFKDETLSGEILETLMRPWYRRLIKWPWLSWEIEADYKDIGYYFWSEKESVAHEIRKKIVGEYPEMEIFPVEDELVQGFSNFVTGTTLVLDRDYPVKIKTFINSVVDSQSAIINSMSDLNFGEKAMIQILMQPARNYQNNFDKAIKIIKNWDIEKEREKVELFESSVHSKQTKLLAHCSIRLVASSKNPDRARAIVKEMGRSFGQFSSEALNRFVAKERWMHIKPLFISDWKKRRFPMYERNLKRVILNIEELSGLVRLPSKVVNNSRLSRLEMKNLEPPKSIIELHNRVRSEGKGNLIKIGTNTFRMNKTNIYIDPKNLSTHGLWIGASGSGKTVGLINLMSDIVTLKLEETRQTGSSKYGFFLIEPHGELSKKLLSNIPEELLDQVNYICPNSHDERFFPFNTFDTDFDSTPDSISKNIADVLKRIWPDGWGVRPDRNMLHAGIALQYCNEASLINVNRLFRDYAYCRTIADQIKDVPEYEEIYETLSELSEMMDPDATQKATNRRQHRELTDSTRNKLEHFSLSTLLHKAVGAHTCGFRWRQWMDEGKITILDLSKIKNDAEKKMYGAMALTMQYQAALTREELIEKGEELTIYPTIVDELPAFISNNAQVVVDMADRTRYVKVPIIGAAQGIISQMPKDAAQAILRNFSTIIAYRVRNSDDADAIADLLNHENLSSEELKRTPDNYAYMALSTGRSSSRTFSALMDKPRNEKIDNDLIERVLNRTWKEAMDREEKVTKEREKSFYVASFISNEGETEESDASSKIVDLSKLEDIKSNDSEPSEELRQVLNQESISFEKNDSEGSEVMIPLEDNMNEENFDTKEDIESFEIQFSISKGENQKNEGEIKEEDDPWELLNNMNK